MATTPLAVALALDAGDETVGPAAFARSAGEYLFFDDGALRRDAFALRAEGVARQGVCGGSRRDRRERGVSRRRATEDARWDDAKRGGNGDRRRRSARRR